MPVRIFEEETPFKLPHKIKHKRWVGELAKKEGYKIAELIYIFCTDEYLLEINNSYLNHDTYTDIITFDLREEYQEDLSGEIYISIDRIKDNAAILDVPFESELLRVMSHGLLHLCGYKDKTENQSEEMRAKENEAIALYYTNIV